MERWRPVTYCYQAGDAKKAGEMAHAALLVYLANFPFPIYSISEPTLAYSPYDGGLVTAWIGLTVRYNDNGETWDEAVARQKLIAAGEKVRYYESRELQTLITDLVNLRENATLPGVPVGINMALAKIMEMMR